MRSPRSNEDPAQPINNTIKLLKNMSFKGQNQGQAPAQELRGKRLRSEGDRFPAQQSLAGPSPINILEQRGQRGDASVHLA